MASNGDAAGEENSLCSSQNRPEALLAATSQRHSSAGAGCLGGGSAGSAGNPDTKQKPSGDVERYVCICRTEPSLLFCLLNFQGCLCHCEEVSLTFPKRLQSETAQNVEVENSNCLQTV